MKRPHRNDAASPERFRKTLPIWLSIVLLSTVLATLVLGGAIFYSRESAVIRGRKNNELLTIAKLKIDQISQWREEILLMTKMISMSAGPARAADTIRVRPRDAEARREMAFHLERISLIKGYNGAAILDESLKPFYLQEERPVDIGEKCGQLVLEALGRNEIIFGDLYREAPDHPVHIDVVAPLMKGGPTAMVLLIRIDPEDFLYPLLGSWPIPAESAETLIVRKEGEAALFLNPTRFSDAPPLTLTIPLDRSDVPAVRGVLGHTGYFNGVDYLGEKVIAQLLKVPSTNWVMIAKMKEDEIFAEVKTLGISIIVVTVISMFLAVSLAAFMFSHRRRLLYQSLYAMEKEKLEVQEEIRKLNQELEARVKDRTAQLEAANQELEAFSYSISHDLRAPLRALYGFSELLASEYGRALEGNGVHYLERIRAASLHMGELIEDLLKLSRITRQEMNRMPVDLAILAREAVAEILAQEPGYEAEADIAASLPAFADPRLMRIALHNLLSNAFKFSGKKSLALVEFGAEETDGRKVYFVRDNGVGFDMAYAEKLFAPFQRLHDAIDYPGTGVGLVIVQRIISKHGGRLWAESEPDKGAIFRFTLG